MCLSRIRLNTTKSRRYRTEVNLQPKQFIKVINTNNKLLCGKSRPVMVDDFHHIFYKRNCYITEVPHVIVQEHVFVGKASDGRRL